MSLAGAYREQAGTSTSDVVCVVCSAGKSDADSDISTQVRMKSTQLCPSLILKLLDDAFMLVVV